MVCAPHLTKDQLKAQGRYANPACARIRHGAHVAARTRRGRDPSLPPDPAMASGATVEGPPNGGGEGEGSRHDGMGEDELRKTMAEIFVDFGLGILAEI